MGWSDWNSNGNGFTAAPQQLPPGAKPGSWGIPNPFKGITDESQSTKDQRANLFDQGNRASDFADQGQGEYGQLGTEAAAQREALRRLALGQDSLSAEQLRQGLATNVAAQRSMAAGASPQNAVMAARTAAIQSARLGSGFAGQQAMAGIAERNAAQKALTDAILAQRNQATNVALGSRQNATTAYGGVRPEASTLDKYMPIIQAGAGIAGAAFGKK